MMWIYAQYYVPSYVGPISSRTSGSDFSWLIGMVVGGLVYWVLAAREVRNEVSRT